MSHYAQVSALMLDLRDAIDAERSGRVTVAQNFLTRLGGRSSLMKVEAAAQALGLSCSIETHGNWWKARHTAIFDGQIKPMLDLFLWMDRMGMV